MDRLRRMQRLPEARKSTKDISRTSPNNAVRCVPSVVFYFILTAIAGMGQVAGIWALRIGFNIVESIITLYRARQKSNPIGKIRYLWNCCSFFSKLTVVTEEVSDYIFCKFHCNICLRSKNLFELKCHFSK